jgi:hypothetical protein
MVEHPWWRDGKGVAAVDKGEGVGKLCRVFRDESRNVSMVADQPFELRLNQFRQVVFSFFEAEIVAKSLEFFSSV